MNKRKLSKLNNCLNTFKNSWSDLDNLMNLDSNWQKIVGKDLSQECKPLKIEKNVLTIVANHPQWRQELIYYKHKLKESIAKYNINLKSIRVIQNYNNNANKKINDFAFEWANHPSRIKDSQIVICKICNCPTPKGEIERWGKCTFCWRETI